jgi:hypothetical protein
MKANNTHKSLPQTSASRDPSNLSPTKNGSMRMVAGVETKEAIDQR